jgi:TPR repeat protein
MESMSYLLLEAVEGVVMNVKKIIIGLTLSLLLGSGVTVAADFDKGLKAAQSGDFKTALAEWMPLAEQGNANAQRNLGLMYDNGDGVRENDKTAVKWYTLAAEQGLDQAQSNLGLMYENGLGVQENHETAVKWYTLAAEQGLDQAQSNLGFMYYNGKGVTQDYKTSAKWYALAAKQGNVRGQFMLGVMYHYGQGVTLDKTAAVKWYTLAAEQGDSKAKENLSILLLVIGKEIFSSEPDGHDCSGAIDYFEKAQEVGNEEAPEYIEFCKTYQRASKGEGMAQYEIAMHFDLGYLVSKNPKTALSWGMKARSNGVESADKLIGEILINDLVYGSDVQKLRDLSQLLNDECYRDLECAFDKVWKHLDISQDGNLSLAELSKFQRDLVQFAYIEELGSDVEIADAAAINLTSILLLPITSSSILHSFDYNNDGTLQKEEVVGQTEFAKLVGVDAQSLINGVEFQALGNKLSSSMKNLRLPFGLF